MKAKLQAMETEAAMIKADHAALQVLFSRLQQGRQEQLSAEQARLVDAAPSAVSVDVETMKLKRLIDKRSQMFDMLRQIIDKNNQTEGIIDSKGR